MIINPRPAGPIGPAVVIGGASGIGAALADTLAARGAAVVLADVDIASARQRARLMTNRGVQVAAMHCDVTDVASISAVHRAATELFGTPLTLVNTAGVAAVGRVEDLSLDDWSWVLDIDLLGVVDTVGVFLPAMLAQGRGQIITLASIAGLIPHHPLGLPYLTAKHGVVGFCVNLAVAVRHRGIAVTCVCPGPVATEFGARARAVGAGAASFRPDHSQPPVSAESVAELTMTAVDSGTFLVTTDASVPARMAHRMAHLDEAIHAELQRFSTP